MQTPNLILGEGSTTYSDSSATLTIHPGGTAVVIGSTTTHQGSNSAIINLTGGTLKTGSLDRSNGGTLNWTAGTLHLTGGTATGGAINVPSPGVLMGTGTIIGNVSNAGALEPGNSPGTLNITGNLANTGTLSMEIASLASFDQLNLTGDFTAGGTIAIELIFGFSPAAGDTFDLMDFASLIDSGYSFDFTNAPLSGSLVWDTSAFASTGSITVVIPEPATLSLLACGGMFLGRRRRAA